MSKKKGIAIYQPTIDKIMDICMTEGKCKNCIFSRYYKEAKTTACRFGTPPSAWNFGIKEVK